MLLASNCTCAVYFTCTAHVPLLAKKMAATHVHAICMGICTRNQTNTLRFCREDNPLYVFTLAEVKRNALWCVRTRNFSTVIKSHRHATGTSASLL